MVGEFLHPNNTVRGKIYSLDEYKNANLKEVIPPNETDGKIQITWKALNEHLQGKLGCSSGLCQ